MYFKQPQGANLLLYLLNGIGLASRRFSLPLTSDKILEPHGWFVRHINAIRNPEARVIKHQTSVKDVSGCDLISTELTNNFKMDFCPNAITINIWEVKKNQYIYFANIVWQATDTFFDNSHSLHKVRAIFQRFSAATIPFLLSEA